MSPFRGLSRVKGVPPISDNDKTRFHPTRVPEQETNIGPKIASAPPSNRSPVSSSSQSPWTNSPAARYADALPSPPCPDASPLRLIIAEADDFCRHIVRLLCQSEFGHDLVGLARDGQQAVDLIDTTEPHLLILDLYLFKHNGFDVAAFARRRCPKIKIIAFTAARGRYTVQQIEQAGFDAYVDKGDHAVDCLRNAIRAVTEDLRRSASSVPLKPTRSD